MPGVPDLADALTREHHAIDSGIEAFMTDLTGTGPVDVRALETAAAALRRHIYLEESFLFPELKAAGLWPALMVMHREHGEIWRLLDDVSERVVALPTDPSAEARESVLAGCRALLAVLDKHNAKEEPIVYPRADTELDSEQVQRLTAFLATGTTPPGWVCRDAKAA